MTVLATLPMYDWPEERAALDAFYTRLRTLVPELPAALTRPQTAEDLHALWRNPALLLGQTCWGPMGAGLDAHVHVLAQPSYDDVPGGRGPRYRSALVMRAGKPCPVPANDGASLPPGLDHLQPAINAADSLSGCLSLIRDADLPDLPARALVTGGHRASIRAVAEGAADYAAIDCRSWALALRHEPAASAITVTGWTALRPGLPFITARATPAPLRARLRDALMQLGALTDSKETA